MKNIFQKQTKTIQISAYTEFANRLASKRKLVCLTQGDVAKALGRTRPAVANWEIGRSLPALPEFIAWCRLCKVTPNEMLGFKEPK